MERLQPGVNGAVVPARDRYGRPGFRFQAPDGTFGPFHLRLGTTTKGFWLGFGPARADWQRWADAHPTQPAGRPTVAP